MRGKEFLDKMEYASPAFIEEAEKLPPRKAVRKPFKILLVACLIIAALAVPVTAEMRSGYVSNLLAPLYGFAQTELTDSIGKPLNAVTVVGDYALSADAVIGDRYNLAVVFSLRRIDGKAVPDNLRFRDFDILFCGNGAEHIQYIPSEDRKTLYIIDNITVQSPSFLRRRHIEAVCNDPFFEKEEETIPYLEGDWSLRFSLRYPDVSKTYRLHNLSVTDAEGYRYTFHRLVLSPVGIHLDFTGEDPATRWGTYGPYWESLVVQVELQDGTMVPLDDRNVGGSGKSGSKKYKLGFGAVFPTPIPMDQIKAVHVCDQVISVSP